MSHLFTGVNHNVTNFNETQMGEIFGQGIFNVKAYGAMGSGAGDDYGAIQNAIDAAKDAKGTIIIPQGTYPVTNTLDFTNIQCVRMLGMGSQGQVTGTKLVWNGSDGGTVLNVYGARDNIFENFSIAPGTGIIGIGIVVNQATPAAGYTCTNNTFRNMQIEASSGTTGIKFSVSGGDNVDLCRIENVHLIGNSVGTYGIWFGAYNAKWHQIIGGNIVNWTHGIYVDKGSFQSFGTNFSGNGTDISLISPTDSILIAAPQSEGADRFLVANGSAAAWPVTVVGGRLAHDGLHADGYYILFGAKGTLTCIGTNFAETANASWLMGWGGVSAPGPQVELIGCCFPNSTILDAGNFRANLRGCNYVDGSGVAQHLNDQNIISGVSSQGFYNTTPGAKPTITGSKGANAALTSLLSALATLGLVTDSTS